MYIFRWPYVHFQMLDEENKLIFLGKQNCDDV